MNTGSATLDGITSTSNTLSDDQIRERLGASEPADTAVADTPAAETPAPPVDEPPAKEPKAKRYDATKDPEVRIGKATAERERAREEAARERERGDRLQREIDEYRAKSEKPAHQAPTAQQPGTASAEPTLNDFADQPDPYAAYMRALAKFDREQDWASREQKALETREKARQEHTAQQRQQAEETRIAAFGNKLQTALAADPSLEPLMASTDFDIPRPMADAIIESDSPHLLIAHLIQQKDTPEVQAIFALEGLKQFRALARLDAQLEFPASGHSGIPAPKKTAAQPPISPVSGSAASPASGPPDPKTCSQEEYDAYWNAQERESRRGGRR